MIFGLENNATDLKLLTFYLPQFHPIPENDAWWGKGFTEWTNVARAKPLFEGHHQPQLPSDLGFYDLRLREVRYEQIRMARRYGIDGFCYYYYWFSGKRLLESPLEDMLADPQSDMPFCLCWANENWTRRWSGDEQEILIEQRYLPEDAKKFAHDIARYLIDPRYIRCNGVPLLVIYRPQQIPDIHNVVRIWREQFRSEGVGEVHLSAALTHNNFDYEQFGFDSGVEFPPHNRALLGVGSANQEVDFHEPFKGAAIKYQELATAYLNRDLAGKRIFRGVFPAWDNTARSGSRAQIFLGSSPENYATWLFQAIKRGCQDDYPGSRFVFINAWNEWAEGCHLEPDQKYQRRYLEATLLAKSGGPVPACFKDAQPSRKPVARQVSFSRDLKYIIQRHFYLWLRGAHETFKARLVKTPRLKRLLKSMLSWY